MPPPCLRLVLGALILALPSLSAARAQDVDYVGLEQIFGEPVTTSVTGKPQRETEAPANITILTRDDIRRSGALTIPDLLAFVTGVYVRPSGIMSADVGMRGTNQMSNPRVMVLVDGREVYMPDFGRVEWATIPVQLSEIRQIEIIRGPNSALYGFNAASGVINIITTDPRRERIDEATLTGGTQNTAAASVVGTGKIGENSGLRLSAGGMRASDYPPGPLVASDAASRRNPYTGTFNSDLRVELYPGVEGFLSASFGDTRLAQNSPAGLYDTEVFHTNSVRAGINADTSIGLLSLSGYHDETIDSFYSVMPGASDFWLKDGETVSVVQASDLIKIGANHTLRAGLELRDNAETSAALGGRQTNLISAASLMWDWRITPVFSVTNAVRLDHVDFYYHGTPVPGSPFTAAQYGAPDIDVVSFNSGAVWKVTPLDTLRLSLARGVQMPSLLQQAFQLPAGAFGPAAFFGTPDLRPSIIWSGELDYDRALPALSSTLRTAAFAQRINNVLSSPFGGPTGVDTLGNPAYFAANVGYAIVLGGEIGISGHNDAGWRWNLSYALAATSDHTTLNDNGNYSSPSGYDRAVPSHVVIAGLGYSHDKWEVDVQGRWQSSYVDSRFVSLTTGLEPVNVSNYVVFNTRIAYALTENLTLALTLAQFNQARFIETGGPPIERRALLSATLRW